MDETPLSTAAEQILSILRQRDGKETLVQLTGARDYTVFNIAWGQDIRDPELHITTNISPSLDGRSLDFFLTNEVIAIVEPSSGTRLFTRPAL